MLALETATLTGSIAIVEDSVLIGEVRISVRIDHSERLMNSIKWLLSSSGISPHEIDAFAVSIGPGSFTGLRIGLSTAKGLAYATGKPLVPVLTLDAFARSFSRCSLPVCPMLDARKNEIYTALYIWEAGLCRKVISETAVNPADFLREISQPTLFTGDGAMLYRDLIRSTLKQNAIFASSSRMSPSAATVAEIALEELPEGGVADPAALRPLYIRKSEAEIRWKA